MFIVSKDAFKDLKICTTVFENPHCGKSLVPFINKTILFDVTTLSNVVFNSGVKAETNQNQKKPKLHLRLNIHILICKSVNSEKLIEKIELTLKGVSVNCEKLKGEIEMGELKIATL